VTRTFRDEIDDHPDSCGVLPATLDPRRAAVSVAAEPTDLGRAPVMAGSPGDRVRNLAREKRSTWPSGL